MKADIRQTKIIHFADEDISKVTVYRSDETKIRSSISIDVFAAFENRLMPIIVEGHIEILKDNLVLFSCIMHTKVLLEFDFNEQPVSDLMTMLDTVKNQETQEWGNRISNTDFKYLTLDKIAANNEVNFNKAYQLIEQARKRQLLA